MKEKIGLTLILILVVSMSFSSVRAVSTDDTGFITPKVDCKFTKVVLVRQVIGNAREIHMPYRSLVTIKPKITYIHNLRNHRVFAGSANFKIYTLEGKLLYSKKIGLMLSYLGGSYYIPRKKLQRGHYKFVISYSGSKRLKLNSVDQEGDLYVY